MDGLLSGDTGPEDAPAGLRPVAEVLAALQAPPDPGEHAAWHQALAMFREAPSVPGPELSRRARPRLATRLAAVAAAVAVALLGGMAAAYTDSLPVGLQKIAHRVIAAPDAHPGRPAPATTSRPASPDVTGSDAHSLCTAYQHASASQRVTAFRGLVEAAGGADKVGAYCGSVPQPGTTAPSHGQGQGQGHGHGQSSPSAAASPSHSGHHGKPSTSPSHGKKS